MTAKKIIIAIIIVILAATAAAAALYFSMNTDQDNSSTTGTDAESPTPQVTGTDEEATALFSQGQQQLEAGEFDAARTSFERAKAIYESNGNSEAANEVQGFLTGFMDSGQPAAPVETGE